ncbi:MAG TPA: hypothetical protein DCO83_07470 [Mucilaginibacter sp.]|nr:hypothetical protein [Mucilaginibacter sp.]
MGVAYILLISSTVSGVLPVIAALYNYRHLDKALKIAAGYFVLSVLSDLVLEVSKRMGMVNNLPVIHIYIALSILFFAAIYYYAFFKPAAKKATIVMAVLALLVVIFNMIFMEGIWDYPSLSNTVLSLLLICFSLAYFYQLLNRQEFIHIEKQGLFWINAGVLFYFSITIFLFMLFKRMIIAHQEGYYIINNITNIIANVLYSVGLLCKPQKTT